MSEYIEREAAIEAMYEDAEAHPGHTFWVTQHEALRNIPAADVRPVGGRMKTAMMTKQSTVSARLTE